MVAIIGAVLFGLALIFDLARLTLGDVVTTSTLVDAGLLCVALHLAGIGTNSRSLSWRPRRRRR